MAINGDGTWNTITWPYPQVRFLEFYTLGFSLVSTNLWLYELYCDTSDVWQSTAMQNLGAVSGITQIEVAESGLFYIVSTYGETDAPTINSFIRNPGTSSPKISALPNTNIPEHGAVCNYNGQFLIGCMPASAVQDWIDMDLNTVAWSQIGRAEFRMSDDVSRTAAYMNMPWGEGKRGIVYKIKKLGNRVIVYGDGGKVFLNPVSQPISTFGMQVLAGPGVRSGNHVDGDDDIHGFISSDYEWWLATADGRFQKIGYYEFLQPLVAAAATRVSYEPKSKRFYISNGVTGYVFTEQGLYSTHQLVTSIGNYRGKTLCGFFGDSADNEFRVVTDMLDFGIRGLKTIETMEISADSPVDIYGAVDYRYDKTGSFTRSTWNKSNERGGVGVIKTAPEFRLGVKASAYADVNLDYINAGIKTVDRRMLRGKYDIKEK